MKRRVLTFCWAVCLALGLAGSADAQSRWALLIGIDEYQSGGQIPRLFGAAEDARRLASALIKTCGFPQENVHVLTSDGTTKPTKANIYFELGQLASHVKRGDIVFVLYSGHGAEMDGQTYLLPYDADNRNDLTIKGTAISTNTFRTPLSRLPAGALIMAYDMCRNDPRTGGKSLEANPLTNLQAKDLQIAAGGGAIGPQRVVTLYSCKTGERSWEMPTQKRGYFSYFLEEGIRKGAVDMKGAVKMASLISYMETTVPAQVSKDKGVTQTPWASLDGNGAVDFVLASDVRASVGATAKPVGGQAQAIDTEAHIKITSNPPGARILLNGQDSGRLTPSTIDVELGLEMVKPLELSVQLNGHKNRLFRVQLERGKVTVIDAQLEKRQVVVPEPEPVRPSVAAKPGQTRINPVDGAEMIFIPAGSFRMGGAFEDSYEHTVFLDGYWMYKNLVTVSMYRKFCIATARKMPDPPTWGWKDDHPMVKVTWFDAMAYAKWARGSLPTEAQWEKAARGTEALAYPWGNRFDPTRLWSSAAGGKKRGTAPVGSHPTGASPYGIMDMAGNVWQWCYDWYETDYYKIAPGRNPQGPESGEKRILRGGCWDMRNPDFFRSGYRYRYYPEFVDDHDGIRVVVNE